MLRAFLGALGFFSRIPVPHGEAHWQAFARTPATFPLVGYLLGAIVALPLLAPVPAPIGAVAFVAWLYLVTGITHLDGLADLGDAVAVHGSTAERRAVMADPTVGAGGVLAIGLVLLALVAGGLVLVTLPYRALAIVVTAEVGAKTGMAIVGCLGTASHEGLGSAITERATPWSLPLVGLLAVPAALLTWPRPLPAVVALTVAVLAAPLVLVSSRRLFDGVSGDVLGATNELARVAALNAGVIAWTLS